MKHTNKCALIGAAFILMLGLADNAQTQSAEEFYRGKTVTLVVSSPAGSLTDLIARHFVDYFARHIPGQPEVIVSNVPGAGGVISAARLQLDAPRDGTVIAFLQRNNLYRAFVDEDENAFDPREVSWIGSLDKVSYILAVSNRSPLRTAEDMFTKRTILGATGVGNDNRTLLTLMNRYLGTQFRIIHGYDGRAEVYLAMERGEVDGWASTIDGLLQPGQVEMIGNGELIPIVHMDWETHPDFPDLPNLSAYVEDEEIRSVIDFFLFPMAAGRPLAAPKGLPPERLAAFREAFQATVNDPEYRASMRSRNWTINPISGEAVEAIRERIYQTPESTLETVREILAPPRRI